MKETEEKGKNDTGLIIKKRLKRSILLLCSLRAFEANLVAAQVPLDTSLNCTWQGKTKENIGFSHVWRALGSSQIPNSRCESTGEPSRATRRHGPAAD